MNDQDKVQRIILPIPDQLPILAYPVLLLADDNRDLLIALAETLRTRFIVAGVLSDGRSVLNEIAALAPDIALLDISLGDMTGFEVAAQLRVQCYPTKIIFLTFHEDVDFVSAAFDLGASGYVFKSRIAEDLIKAIEVVSSGGRFEPFPPDSANRPQIQY
jgi:DNA-binding NarL/FixJ family response regulator